LWWGTPNGCSVGVTGTVALALSAGVLSSPCLAVGTLAEPLTVLSRPTSASSFAQPMGVAVDTVGGLVIIADTGNHRIRIFDDGGYPISSFLHMADGPKGLVPGEPRTIAVARQGTLYVLDTQANYIDVMDLLGNSLGRIQPGELARALPNASALGEKPEDFRTVALALDRQDRLVLAVGSFKTRIWVLDENRSVIRIFDGSEGGGTALGSVTDLFVDGEGRIYVTDGTLTPAVRVFSREGAQLLAFGQRDTGDENFSLPGSVVATDDGRIWVLDPIRQVVKVFGEDGRLLGMLGGLGRRMGDFLYPSRLATDGRDRLYVLERVGARLTTFAILDAAESVSQ
jgi:DNA-binding beta-propeller fold protein YncE